MPSPNIHRLISAFLTVAVIASSAVWSISYIRGRAPQVFYQTSGPKAPENAFVEPVPKSNGLASAPYLNINLTEGLAADLAAQVVAKNPDGPAEREGELSIVFPGNTDAILAEYLAKNPVPRAAVFTSLAESDISITKDGNPGEIEKYAIALGEIVSSLNVADYSAEAQEEWISSSAQNFRRAANSLKAMRVPAEATRAHIILSELIATSANYFDLIERDPIAASALYQEFRDFNNRHIAEWDGLVRESKVGQAAGGVLAKLLLVQTAHATWPVIDWVAIGQAIKDFLQKAWEIAQEVLMEYAKNYLLREMSRQVVNWILGNGEPQFITNWQAFFRNAADEALGAVIAEAAPSLCGAGLSGYLGGVASAIRDLMKPVDIGQKRNYVGCTLTRVINNIDDFRRDIRNGGWIGYGTVFESQNTMVGQLIALSSNAAQRVVQQREALVQKVEQGYLPTEECEDGSKPSPTGACPPPADDSTLPSPTGGLGQDANGNMTVVREPQVTSPANIKANVTVRSFDAAYDRIINTSGKAGWAAMGAFILDAMITKLVVSGVKGLGGAANVDYIGTVGDEAPSLTFDGRIEQMLQLKNSSLSSARSTETTISQTISTLSQVVTACASTPNVASSANLQKSALVIFRNELATDIVRLSNDVTNLEKMRDATAGSYTIADIEPAVGTVPAAQDEAKAFAKKRNDAEAALQESSRTLSSCDADASTTIPPPTQTTTTPPLGP